MLDNLKILNGYKDVVQLFSRSAFRPVTLGVDAFTANFYKMHGPTGIGILVTSNKLIEGYKLKLKTHAIPNIPAIAGALFAYRNMLENRAEKNSKLLKMKRIFIETIDKYNLSKIITWLSPIDYVLPNTILFSINKDMTQIFEENNIIVHFEDSENYKNSSKISSENSNENSNKIIIRISFSDNNTIDELKKIIKLIMPVLAGSR